MRQCGTFLIDAGQERDGDPILVALDDASRRIGELWMKNNLVGKDT